MKAGVTDRLWSINLTTTVPLNMSVLRAMRRSPLGIDLYLWLTLTTFRILQKKKKSLKLYWRQLYQQFGAEPEKMTDQRVEWFRNDAIRELKKLHLAWPELQYRVVRGSRRKGREKEGHLILGVTPSPDTAQRNRRATARTPRLIPAEEERRSAGSGTRRTEPETAPRTPGENVHICLWILAFLHA